MKYLSEYRDATLAQELLKEIKSIVTKPWTLMSLRRADTQPGKERDSKNVARADYHGAWPWLPGVRNTHSYY